MNMYICAFCQRTRELNKADHESTKELQQVFGQYLGAIWQACGRYFVGTWSLCGNNLVAIIWSLFAKLLVARLLAVCRRAFVSLSRSLDAPLRSADMSLLVDRCSMLACSLIVARAGCDFRSLDTRGGSGPRSWSLEISECVPVSLPVPMPVPVPVPRTESA